MKSLGIILMIIGLPLAAGVGIMAVLYCQWHWLGIEVPGYAWAKLQSGIKYHSILKMAVIVVGGFTPFLLGVAFFRIGRLKYRSVESA